MALVSLAGFCAVAAYLGWGQHLLIVALPFGLVSMLLSYWHDRSAPSPTQEELITHPFSSLAEVVRARRRLPGFRKRKFPRHLEDRTIRGRLGNAAVHLNFRAMWAILSPLALLFQSLPVTEYDVKVVVPEPARSTDAAGEQRP